MRAGLAVTPRLSRQAMDGVHALPARDGLPPLGSFPVMLLRSPEPPSPAVTALASAIRSGGRRW